MANPHNYINQGDDNPWKGLNFYVEGETLYGRDTEIQRLAQFIVNNSQTVLYGKSGIGKSSIINAGIFPIARQQGLFPVPLRFGHSQQSSAYYLEQIKEAFRQSGIGINPLRDAIDENSESLWEFFHRHTFFQPETGNAVRPLVVFDQFEEIFTLQHNEAAKKEFFSQLADLINEVKPRYIFDAQYSSDNRSNGSDEATSLQDLKDFVQNIGNKGQLPNYVEESLFNLVFVIREDYLSYFERYTAYIPAMKANRFPLLPLNEEQAAEIILRPREGLVSKEVAELIIKKVTGTADFKLDGIPEIEVSATMLSLYLSRLFLKKGDQETITAEMVNQFGDYIIKDFYEESIANLPQDEIEKLEDELITNGMRDNSFISYMTDKDNNPNAISKKTIDTLVKCKLLRQYPDQKELRVEFMHDILCPVVNERIEQRESARREEAEHRRQEEERKKRENEIRDEEEKKRKEILLKAEQERLRHEQETKQIKERNHKRIKRTIVAAALIMTILAGFFIRYWLYEKPYSCTYANFTTLDGWPVGINEIDPGRIESETKGTTFGRIIVYYRLTRKGSLNRNPFYKVEVISAHDHKPTTNKFIESPVVGLWCSEFGNDKKAKDFAELQKKTSYWIYTASEQGAKTAGKSTAFGIDGKELYSVQFNRDNTTAGDDEGKYVQWAVYYDASGKQMIIKDNGIDRMRQSIDNGTVIKCLFFSMLGVPQKNERGAYGYLYGINDTTHLLKEVYRVNKFGNEIPNDSITYLEYEYGRPKKTSIFEVIYPRPGMIVRKYMGFSDTLEFYNKGQIKHGSVHPDFTKRDSVITFSYDENGRLTFKQIQLKGQTIESEIYTYLNNSDNDKYREINKVENGISFSERYSYPDDTTEVMEYWQNGNRYTWSGKNELGNDISYNKYVKTTSKNSEPKYIIETKEYYDTAGFLIHHDELKQSENLYAKFKIYRRETHPDNIVFRYYYDEKDSIRKSEFFEYDPYGNVVANGVAGIFGNAVRCPEWSWYSFSCYKMSISVPFGQSVFDSNGFVFASLQGINEFGEVSIVKGYKGDILYDFTINESSNNSSKDYFTKPINQETIQTGMTLSQTIIKKSDVRFMAYFIHIISRESTLSNSGLEDGDVIISINGTKVFPITSESKRVIDILKNNKGCSMTVARANPKENKYVLISKVIPPGMINSHIHQIALSEKENDRLIKQVSL